MQDTRRRRVWAAVLAVATTLIWATLPYGEVQNYINGQEIVFDDRPPLYFKLGWLGIMAVTGGAVALAQLPPKQFWPSFWRGATFLLLGCMFMLVIFEFGWEAGQSEPQLGTVVFSCVLFLAVCGPALWFSLIKPVVRRRR